MKGTITLIKRIIDDHDNIRGYEMIVEFEEKPPFELGDVEVKQ